jgi:hypothetical protein
VIQKGREVLSPAVPGVFEGSLCDLPLAPTPRPDDPGIEHQDGRCCGGGGDDRLSASDAGASPRGPLDVGAVEDSRVAAAFSPPDLSFPGQGYTGVRPPDTVGDVGPRYYIQAVNHRQGTLITAYDKVTGAAVWGPTVLRSLWTTGGSCATAGRGDPIVLYDHLADRWLIAELIRPEVGNRLCDSWTPTASARDRTGRLIPGHRQDLRRSRRSRAALRARDVFRCRAAAEVPRAAIHAASTEPVFLSRPA